VVGGKAQRGHSRALLVAVAALVFLPVALAAAAAGAATVTVAMLSPVSASPGSLLTVTGSGFSSASGLQVKLGGENVPVTVSTDSAISFPVPADARPGPAVVIVSAGGGALGPSFNVTVLTLAALPVGEAGAPYTAALSASGGTAPYSYAVVTGELASGLFLSPAGVFSGAAKTAGTQSFTVTVTDANHLSASFLVGPAMLPGPAVSTSSLANAWAGADYSTALSATAGTPPYSWSIGSGAIPGGLILTSSGVLGGRPGGVGQYSVVVRVTDALGSSATRKLTLAVAVEPPQAALLLATTDGVAETLSTAAGPAVTTTTGSEIVAALASFDGQRAWLVSRRGSVVPIGASPLLGEIGRRPGSPITAAAVRPDGTGYWLVTRTGRVYGFGSARDEGSLLAVRHHGAAVGIAASSGGTGYWVVTTTGEVFAFGTAPALGSTRPGRLRGRIVGIAPTADGKGYWLASSAGSVYAFGSARQAHLGAGVPGLAPVVAIAPAPAGKGYWLVGSGGTVAPFGSAESFGAPAALAVTGVVAAASAR